MSTRKLKKCPFCGGKKVSVVQATYYHAECDDCLASSPCKPTKKEAIAAWNRSTGEGDEK